MLIALLQLAAGFLLLYGAGELLVRGSADFGLALGIAPVVIGLTVVAFGTSAPELAVSVNAALLGQDDIAIANVIGSNICNIGLIVGLTGVISSLRVHPRLIRVDMPIMLGSSLLLLWFLRDGGVSRLDGLLLVCGILAYVGYTIARARHGRPAVGNAEPPTVGAPVARALGMVLAGGAGLAFGARLFVDGAVFVAAALGVSTAVIGMTVVALGTSLPELATSVIAAVRRQADMAIGNIVGSNIFNILSILGLTALVRPLTMGELGLSEGLVMLGFAAAMWLFMVRARRVSRLESGLLLIAYLAYMGWLATGGGV